jgi:FAD synthase
VTNIGISPTFIGAENPGLIMETYIIDRPSQLPDFYDNYMDLLLLRYLRPEAKFTSLEALINQIKDDVNQAKLFAQQTDISTAQHLLKQLDDMETQREDRQNIIFL